jgi:hypothetical protein
LGPKWQVSQYFFQVPQTRCWSNDAAVGESGVSAGTTEERQKKAPTTAMPRAKVEVRNIASSDRLYLCYFAAGYDDVRLLTRVQRSCCGYKTAKVDTKRRANSKRASGFSSSGRCARNAAVAIEPPE